MLASSSAWFAFGGVARAAETVALSVKTCDDAHLRTTQLLEQVQTEVAPALLVEGGSAPPGSVRGTIDLCHGSPNIAGITVVIDSEHALERSIDISDVGAELRARTVAVVFAGMVAQLRARAVDQAPKAELEPSLARVTDTPSPAEPGTALARTGSKSDSGLTAFASTATDPTSGAMRPAFGAGIAVRAFGGPFTLLTGPWLSFGAGSWQTEVLFLRASRDVPLGSVSLSEVLLAGEWRPWKLAFSHLRLSYGVRGELGATWVKGAPAPPSLARGSSQRRPQAAALAVSKLAVPVSSLISAQASAAVGVAYGLTATADGIASSSSSGAFIAVSLGLELRF
jgi:hypothetical protein